MRVIFYMCGEDLHSQSTTAHTVYQNGPIGGEWLVICYHFQHASLHTVLPALLKMTLALQKLTSNQRSSLYGEEMELFCTLKPPFKHGATARQDWSHLTGEFSTETMSMKMMTK